MSVPRYCYSHNRQAGTLRISLDDEPYWSRPRTATVSRYRSMMSSTSTPHKPRFWLRLMPWSAHGVTSVSRSQTSRTRKPPGKPCASV